MRIHLFLILSLALFLTLALESSDGKTMARKGHVRKIRSPEGEEFSSSASEDSPPETVDAPSPPDDQPVIEGGNLSPDGEERPLTEDSAPDVESAQIATFDGSSVIVERLENADIMDSVYSYTDQIYEDSDSETGDSEVEASESRAYHPHVMADTEPIIYGYTEEVKSVIPEFYGAQGGNGPVISVPQEYQHPLDGEYGDKYPEVVEIVPETPEYTPMVLYQPVVGKPYYPIYKQPIFYTPEGNQRPIHQVYIPEGPYNGATHGGNRYPVPGLGEPIATLFDDRY